MADLPELQEATAATQALALDATDDQLMQSRLDDLEQLQGGLDTEIVVMPNGPYLVTNARYLYNWLGERLSTTPQMALCRCGQSGTKPFCDGTHASIGFTDAKDPRRVPDRCNTYGGVQVTVLDNRGTCQHTGFCTSRLPTVFREGQEPFVRASGGRRGRLRVQIKISYAASEGAIG